MPFVRPAGPVDLGEGPVPRIIREWPGGPALPPEGRNVPATAFWLRRLRDGDVVEVPPEQESGTASVATGGAKTPEQESGTASVATGGAKTPEQESGATPKTSKTAR